MPRFVVVKNEAYRDGDRSVDPDPQFLDFCKSCWPPNLLTVAHKLNVPLEWVEEDFTDHIDHFRRHPTYAIISYFCYNCGRTLSLADN